MKIHFNSFLYPSILEKSVFLKNAAPFLHKESYVLVMLNSESFSCSSKLLRNIWNSFEIHICADGSANRLHQMNSDHLLFGAEPLIPEYIAGDLDSIDDIVLERFRSLGTAIVHDPNQDNNDAEKCIKLSLEIIKNKPIEDEVISLVLFGAFGGRLDQEMASFHTAFRFKDNFNRIILLDQLNEAFILPPDVKNLIYPKSKEDITKTSESEGPVCGLIPLFGRADSVFTKGLKWNLQGQGLQFGDLISSSNEISRPHLGLLSSTLPSSDGSSDGQSLLPCVEVISSNYLLWTCEINMQ